MKFLGWALIVVFGGGVLYLLGDWIVRTLNGYYVNGESVIALAITGFAAAFALVPIGIGVWLVRRESGGSEQANQGARSNAIWIVPLAIVVIVALILLLT